MSLRSSRWLPEAERPLTVVSPKADARFGAHARSMGLDPNARFVGGYVDWEMSHARHLFDGLVESVSGRRVLEVGCNVGATAIVLAALGAKVWAIDRNIDYVRLAQLNAERHGFADAIAFSHVLESRWLPFTGGQFDWVVCNSVLEYVEPDELLDLLRELHRVLRSGGVFAILGTSNRLFPRENHSGRWLVNYIPRGLERRLGLHPWPRGVWPWTIRSVLRSYDDLTARDGSRLFLELKERMGMSPEKLAVFRLAGQVLGATGVPLGCLSPTITMILRKR